MLNADSFQAAVGYASSPGCGLHTEDGYIDEDSLECVLACVVTLIELQRVDVVALDDSQLRELFDDVADVLDRELQAVRDVFAYYEAQERARYAGIPFDAMQVLFYKDRDGVLHARIDIGDQQLALDISRTPAAVEFAYELQSLVQAEVAAGGTTRRYV